MLKEVLFYRIVRRHRLSLSLRAEIKHHLVLRLVFIPFWCGYEWQPHRKWVSMSFATFFHQVIKIRDEDERGQFEELLEFPLALLQPCPQVRNIFL